MKRPRKVFPTQLSVIKELRSELRHQRDWHLEQAEDITKLLARTEPAKHKRFQPGDEITEIG